MLQNIDLDIEKIFILFDLLCGYLISKINLNQTNTLEFFNNLQSEHTNLNIIKLNFLNYTTYHDVIIISVDANDVDWNKIYDHALSLNPKLIIGRHKWAHRSDVINSLNNYEHTNYDFGIYVLHQKL